MPELVLRGKDLNRTFLSLFSHFHNADLLLPSLGKNLEKRTNFPLSEIVVRLQKDLAAVSSFLVKCMFPEINTPIIKLNFKYSCAFCVESTRKVKK